MKALLSEAGGSKSKSGQTARKAQTQSVERVQIQLGRDRDRSWEVSPQHDQMNQLRRYMRTTNLSTWIRVHPIIWTNNNLGPLWSDARAIQTNTNYDARANTNAGANTTRDSCSWFDILHSVSLKRREWRVSPAYLDQVSSYLPNFNTIEKHVN